MVSLSKLPTSSLYGHSNSIRAFPSPVTVLSLSFHPTKWPATRRIRCAVNAKSEGSNVSKEEEEEGWVDWEDKILEDTVPLVGFVRMILHSGKYEIGERLSPEHERTIADRLLPYHPQCEKKIGCGIDYITVGYHPDFESSRCLFITRKDGQSVDFSYWKCIKGMIRKNYPLYADTFIRRHFGQRGPDRRPPV